MLACSKEGHERERASSPLSGSALVLSPFPWMLVSGFCLSWGPSPQPDAGRGALSRLDTQKSSFLHPLELGVLTGTCQPPHPNPLPQHLWSCSPGNTDASSLSGHRSVASDTGVCVPSESVNGLGNPKSLDTAPKALRTRPSFRSTVVPTVISVAVPLRLQNSLPKVLHRAQTCPPGTNGHPLCRPYQGRHRPATSPPPACPPLQLLQRSASF